MAYGFPLHYVQMASVALPILTLAVKQQQYSCHGCGNCCRDFTVQVRGSDLEKLNRPRR